MSQVPWSVECRLAQVGRQHGAVPEITLFYARLCSAHGQRQSVLQGTVRTRTHPTSMSMLISLVRIVYFKKFQWATKKQAGNALPFQTQKPSK